MSINTNLELPNATSGVSPSDSSPVGNNASETPDSQIGEVVSQLNELIDSLRNILEKLSGSFSEGVLTALEEVQKLIQELGGETGKTVDTASLEGTGSVAADSQVTSREADSVTSAGFESVDAFHSEMASHKDEALSSQLDGVTVYDLKTAEEGNAAKIFVTDDGQAFLAESQDSGTYFRELTAEDLAAIDTSAGTLEIPTGQTNVEDWFVSNEDGTSNALSIDIGGKEVEFEIGNSNDSLNASVTGEADGQGFVYGDQGALQFSDGDSIMDVPDLSNSDRMTAEDFHSTLLDLLSEQTDDAEEEPVEDDAPYAPPPTEVPFPSTVDNSTNTIGNENVTGTGNTVGDNNETLEITGNENIVGDVTNNIITGNVFNVTGDLLGDLLDEHLGALGSTSEENSAQSPSSFVDANTFSIDDETTLSGAVVAPNESFGPEYPVNDGELLDIPADEPEPVG